MLFSFIVLCCGASAYGAAPAVTLSPTSLTFGTQLKGTKSAAQVITLTNTGTASLTLSNIVPSSPFSQTRTCTATLAAGASCTISVSFTPAVNGVVNGTLTITDNAANSPQVVSLTGTGTIISLTPGTLNFGNDAVGTASASQPITLTNVGQSAANISAITIQGTNPSDFTQTNNCSTTVAAGASCTVNVVFTAGAAGSRSATLNVAPTTAIAPIPATLTGTGTTATSGPVPFLHQPLAPATLAPGSPATTLTLNGAGFAAGDTVQWNGSSRTTTFVSTAKLQASLLVSDLASAGTAQVTVKSGAGGVSNAQAFQISTPVSTLAMAGSALGVGLDPRGVVVADFNNDGKPDLAAINRGSTSVSILKGNGDGTFAAQSSFAVGTDAIALAVGDFNGDGKTDIVTANRASYDISVLLGNGDGTFQTHVDYSAGTEPISIVTADFNGDGKLDVAEVNSADNTISVYLGVGNGTFQAQVTYPTGSSPNAIVAGDFNGDGIVDLAAADSATSNIALLIGHGDGTFAAATFFATGSDPDGLLAADLNGDGK